MRIGYRASAEQFGPRDLVEFAVRAEDLGLDSVFVSDHFLPWRHNGGHAPFSLAWMSAVGERTSRVLIGTSALTPTFRYNPAIIAQAFATMALLTGNRVVLGVGTGEVANEVAVSGVEWPGFTERFGRLRESIDLMRRLWTQDEVTFDGRYYQSSGATVHDRPDRPVPVYVAAGGPVVARYAGEFAGGVICSSVRGEHSIAGELLSATADGAVRAGRSVDRIDRVIEVKLSYDRDPAAALSNTGFWAPLALSVEQRYSVASSVELERLADTLPIEQIARRWIVASDPEQAVAALQFYVDAGFSHLVVHGPGPDQVRFLEQFTHDVVPLLRALAPRPPTLPYGEYAVTLPRRGGQG